MYDYTLYEYTMNEYTLYEYTLYEYAMYEYTLYEYTMYEYAMYVITYVRIDTLFRKLLLIEEMDIKSTRHSYSSAVHDLKTHNLQSDCHCLPKLLDIGYHLIYLFVSVLRRFQHILVA